MLSSGVGGGENQDEVGVWVSNDTVGGEGRCHLD